MVPFERLGTLSYSHSIETGRICSRFDTIHERGGKTPHDGTGRANAQCHRYMSCQWLIWRRHHLELN